MNPLHLAGIGIIAAVGIGSYIAGHKSATDDWQTKWNDEQARIVKLQLEHEQKVRETELVHTTNLEVVKDAWKNEINDLQSDLNSERDSGKRMRNDVRAFAARAKQCANSSAAGSSDNSYETHMVLAELYARADKTAGELAKSYDELEITHKACVVAYDKVRQENNKSGR